MFVLMTDEQVIASDVVCRGCLMANQQGQPRWQDGQLLCGRPLRPNPTQPVTHALPGTPSSRHYECHMGFRLAQVQSGAS
ncbi:MAG: hypothetical protein AAFZ80_02140 [Cyanobacteria bacterium P01_A01_bin.105]